MREDAPVSAPDSCAITRATGPPGANCTTTNDTIMMPSMVGIMNSSLRMMYAPMRVFSLLVRSDGIAPFSANQL